MPTPIPPTSPFVGIDGEDTSYRICATLSLLSEYARREGQSWEIDFASKPDHLFGLALILDGLRDATQHLSHQEAVPLPHTHEEMEAIQAKLREVS